MSSSSCVFQSVSYYEEHNYSVQSLHMNGVKLQYVKVVQCAWDQEILSFEIETRGKGEARGEERRGASGHSRILLHLPVVGPSSLFSITHGCAVRGT